MHASEWSDFKPHESIQLNNSNDSYSLRMSIFRDTTYAIGNVPCCKQNIDLQFHSNPLMNELGFVDGFLENSGFCLTKNKEILLEVLML